MRNKSKKIVTTKEFMLKARNAIADNERYENEVATFCIALIEKIDEILSDGQKQQIERFLDELEGTIK